MCQSTSVFAIFSSYQSMHALFQLLTISHLLSSNVLAVFLPDVNSYISCMPLSWYLLWCYLLYATVMDLFSSILIHVFLGLYFTNISVAFKIPWFCSNTINSCLPIHAYRESYFAIWFSYDISSPFYICSLSWILVWFLFPYDLCLYLCPDLFGFNSPLIC